MAFTRRQVVTVLSVLYLTALTILAALALHSAHAFSLPIPDITCALTVALPALAGIALSTILTLNDRLAAKGHLQTSRILQLTVVAFLIYETVLATLAGTHISPPMSLNCALKERWEHMFQRKSGDRIRRIQDAFSCCGLNSPRDMAFPFPDAHHESNACMVRFERNTACMEPWRDEERKVAIMLLVVPLAVFVWKVAILLAPSSGSAWLPSAIRLPSDRSESPESSRRRPAAIEYRDVENNNNNTGAIEEEADSVRAEVDRLNNDSNLASHIEGGRSKPNAHNGLWREHERWRDVADD
ncbi:hypothetical protein LTR36_010738 [Oleoguttula mirabilis]|uniref:Tetraspanin Tsp3 n=1 Tax=Oleoguttula mirabilis TaxID=1507867 RepID=A0AAV9JSP6_9PEZI|nr:hypothetical protein LTR36_010738 [Oleoguttula mirabilis]